MTRLYALIALLLLATPAAAQVAELDEPERQVLAQAIEQTRLRGNEKWVMVADDVATFDCGGKAVINVGGCGGMRRKTQSIDDVMDFLRAQVPQGSPALFADFRVKAGYPAVVHRPLPLPVAEVVWGRVGDKKGVVAGGPLPEGKPDLVFNVSRVGFDPERHEALAYVAGLSSMDPESQYGEYLYLRNVDGRWKVERRVRVWQLSGAR